MDLTKEVLKAIDSGFSAVYCSNVAEKEVVLGLGREVKTRLLGVVAVYYPVREGTSV